MLTFEAGPHHYFWMGKRVPNVTSVLSMLIDLRHVRPDVLEAARLEGVDMHRMIELEIKDDLDEHTLPAWLLPRLFAFRKFRDETGFAATMSERRVYHRAYGYAGTLDMVGTMRIPHGRKTKTATALIDLKRSFAAGRAIGLQTAAYARALESEEGQKITHRFALRLLADGTYRLEPFDSPTDFHNFLSCLTVHNLKESL
jgi:hypothetical protein